MALQKVMVFTQAAELTKYVIPNAGFVKLIM